jgi:hypothetical protein
MWRHHSCLRTPELHSNKTDDENPKDNKEADDPTVSPRVFGAAPLQREEEGDDGGHEKYVPVEIKALEAFFPPDADDGGAFWIVEQECYGHDGDCAKGQIDVEAEPPGYFILFFILSSALTSLYFLAVFGGERRGKIYSEYAS